MRLNTRVFFPLEPQAKKTLAIAHKYVRTIESPSCDDSLERGNLPSTPRSETRQSWQKTDRVESTIERPTKSHAGANLLKFLKFRGSSPQARYSILYPRKPCTFVTRQTDHFSSSVFRKHTWGRGALPIARGDLSSHLPHISALSVR